MLKLLSFLMTRCINAMFTHIQIIIFFWWQDVSIFIHCSLRSATLWHWDVVFVTFRIWDGASIFITIFFLQICVFILWINFPRSSPFCVLYGKKVRRLEKGCVSCDNYQTWKDGSGGRCLLAEAPANLPPFKTMPCFQDNALPACRLWWLWWQFFFI